MMMDLKKFFDEKQLDFTVWEIRCDDEVHIIDSDTIIEMILETEGNERCKISGVLFSLDFKNACILDYLKYLAECFISANFKKTGQDNSKLS